MYLLYLTSMTDATLSIQLVLFMRVLGVEIQRDNIKSLGSISLLLCNGTFSANLRVF